MGRVSDRATFAALAGTRRRARRGPVSVAWVPGAKGDPVRVAYAVGRRTGAAVVRNRLRRRLRAIVADAHRSDAGLRPGAYLIGASAEAIPLCPNELKALVNQALQALSPASTQNP